MKSALLAPVLFLALPLSARAQQVDYERFTLPNGMTVILHEDHRLPQAAVNLWYHVGSKDEVPGRSGFAHLFEHLMFMGTERAPGSAFDDIMEAGGGSNNASTSNDRTNYFESGPAELLPTLLWLEADRLEDLGRTMTQEKLDKQRAVVRNERRQTSENQPYGRAYLKTFELLYPPGHPYHLPVIGTHEDLEAATVEDVKSFFATYYVPANATLVVAGDFDPAEIRPRIEELFGTLPRGNDPVHRSAAPVRLSEELRHTETDAVQFAQTSMVWHSPAIFAPGDAEMDLLAAILTDGISSRLYQALIVDEELAVDVSAYQASRMLGSSFTISALAAPGVELARIEAKIDAVLEELRREGPTAAEVERQKARLEHQTLDALQSITEKADRLNMYQFHFGEPDSFARDLERYRQATPAGVQEWLRKTLDPNARLVMHVLPELEAPAANPRDEMPAIGAPSAFTPEAPTSAFELPNGLRVLHWRRADLPLVELHLLLPTGSKDDPAGKAGLAELTADMLDEGAGTRDAVAFADALDQLGASVSVRADREWTHARVSALARTAEPAAALAADALLRPRFDAGEWQRVKSLHLAGLRQAQDDPNRVAARVSMQAYFGPEHVYGRPAEGTLESVEALSLEDLRRFHQQHYGAGGATLLVAGDLDEARARALAGALAGGLERSPVPPPLGAAAPANQTFRVVVIDRPGAVQTVMRFLMPAPAWSAADRPARELVTTILGGTFTSRLNANLREDKGYTYGARAGFAFGPSTGYLVASSSVRTDVTGAALREFLKEFRALRSGDITPTELEKAKATARQRTVASFSTLGGLLGAAAETLMHGRSYEAIAEELAQVSKTTLAELNRLAPTTIPLERGLLLLVGDRDAILPQLEGLDLPPIVELDVQGRPVAGD